jgi:hypothetical protein
MRIVFYYLILIPKGYNSLFFNKKEIITFFKTLNKYFKNYKINNNIKKRSELLNTLLNNIKKTLKDY